MSAFDEWKERACPNMRDDVLGKLAESAFNAGYEDGLRRAIAIAHNIGENTAGQATVGRVARVLEQELADARP